jgi:hypothetical protein
MDRLTGLYKRNTKRILLVLGLILTVAFNVNTLQVARSLWREPTGRGAIAQAAGQATANPEIKDVYKSIQEEEKVGLPIGWKAATSPVGRDTQAWLWAIAGWLFTAGALTFGVPFWFDLLGRLNSLRSSGPPPGSPAAGAS